MNTESLSTLKIHKLTQAQYNRELEAGRIDENALYLTPDEEIDFSLYATTEQLNTKSDVEHTHETADVTDLQSMIDSTLASAKSYTDSAVSEKADFSHIHDDIYYTEAEIDEKLDGKADVSSIPTALADLTDDETHRIVTDLEKAAWSAKSNFSGDYNDLSNKPTIPSIAGLATESYVDNAISEMAGETHTHDDRYYTETEIDSKIEELIEISNSNMQTVIANHNTATDAHFNMGWLTSEDEIVSSPTPFDADTLGGYDVFYFTTTETQLNAMLEEVLV